MVAQAREKLLALERENYFFISDDLLLNPKASISIVGGYSNWFILPREDLDVVSRKFGATAAMGLFVEVTVPRLCFCIVSI